MVLRKRALTQKLSQNDLIQVLYWYLAHRGKKYTVEDDDQGSDKPGKKTKDSAYNDYYDKDKLPIEKPVGVFFWRKVISATSLTKFLTKRLRPRIEEDFGSIHPNIKFPKRLFRVI
ncbi:hypothetical protein [Mycoplasma sp. ATU-Cv-508]|uniref:hypothetical protein n=1 Tax=Mycoplasma sp. ATU-Cv-508 TaxID=2048001 RepID=UPI001374CE49